MPEKAKKPDWMCPACGRVLAGDVGQCHHRDGNQARVGASADKKVSAKASPVVPNAKSEKPAKTVAPKAKAPVKEASDESGD